MTGHAHHHGPPAPPSEGADGGAPAAPHQVASSKLLATLAVGGALSGLLVVMVYRVTLPAVQRYAGQVVESAVREVLKAPARWDTLYLVNGKLTRGAPAGAAAAEVPRAFVGFDAAGKRIGVAVTAQEPGFQEELSLMVGFDPATSRLIGIKVLDEKETPGLGDKIERDSAFGAQFPGRVVPLKGVKGAPGRGPSEVQTITGATISSRAVIRIINNAVARWRPLVQAFDEGTAR
jgi:H+/Na+-translocating ferredoxin:NAD+ oxidoreductase subunit G